MLFKKLKSMKFLAKLFVFCFVFIGLFFSFNSFFAQGALDYSGVVGAGDWEMVQPDYSHVIGAGDWAMAEQATGVAQGEIAVSEEELKRIEEEAKKIYGSQFSFFQGVERKKEASSRIFQSMLSTALNTLAFDAANWVASGGKGQGPAFEQRDLGQIALDAADAAAGDLLYNLGQEGIGGVSGLNLCQPSIGVDFRIGLGLQQFSKPKPKCTFSQMRENWEQELRNPNFLRNFQDYFEPTSNDLGIALSVHVASLEKTLFEKEFKVKEAESNEASAGGINPITEMISGLKTTPAKFIYDQTEHQLVQQLGDNIGKYTGDALVDALNIFINQLAIQLIQRLLQDGLFQSDSGSSGGGIYNPYEDASSGGGVRAAKERFREIIQPRFNVRGDYDILTELATCPDPNNAGPTNCVISDIFRQAIQERKTVGQAMSEGLLNQEGVFGFEAKDLEPRYVDEQYPYRSIIILRKFRILPVGWELAAAYINENFATTNQQALKDLVNCFDGSDDYGEKENLSSNDWCRGLVDPNWVLKAPLNYCAREGYGHELISEPQVIQGEYNIQRKDNYCADEQSCIKENYDGSCEVYGYCTEERRTWNFGSDSCEPLYNTCQTFYGNNGESTSYLKNTLQWCDAGGAGCKKYSNLYDYGEKDWKDSSEYFNRNIDQCDSDAEGCTEFIRAKAGLGTNLIPNSSFEEWSNETTASGWAVIGTTERVPAEVSGVGNYAIKVSVNLGTASISKVNLKDSSGVSLFSGHQYILSGLIKPDFRGDGKVSISVGTAVTTALTSNSNNVWQRVYIPLNASNDISNAEVKVIIEEATSGDSVIVDALQLEEVINSNTPSAYKDYRAINVIHEKILPDYLASGEYYHEDGNVQRITGDSDGIQGFCYEKAGDSYRLRDTAPAECFNYARRCTASEASCELYTRTWDGFEIPAKVTPNDYCPDVCNGYDLYIQKETTFESTQGKYLIPSSANTCNAQAAGCDQFTNLDEVELGGEGIEYYSALRHCTTISSDSAPFYVWEGSEDSGFQLRVFTLEQKNGEPNVVSGTINSNEHKDPSGAKVCTEDIFNATAQEPQYNPDCRQFYSRTGVITHALFSQTISYDTNCHPYRRSDVNIDPNLNSDSVCDAIKSGYSNVTDEQFHWDGNNQVCYFCKNNGKWDNTAQACIYMAIPQEGQTCSAAENGCRQYVGNVGNNVRNIIADDFEDGTSDEWNGDSSTGIEPNQKESIRTNGNSIKVTHKSSNASIYKNIGGLITEGKSYTVEILTKGQGNDLSMSLSNGISSINFDNNINLNNEWQKITLSLREFNLSATGNEKLIITGTDGDEYYIDYIILREVVDSYYLIKNSWNTPLACDQNWSGNSDIHYMAGCYQYQDRDSQNHFLKSFSGICSESAVGCELMIDTKNYTSALGASYLGTAGETTNLSQTELDVIQDTLAVKVELDSLVYVVYDPNALCGGSDKGCQRLGEPQMSQGQVTSFSDVYLENNPDRYGEILCGDDDVGCEAYRDNNNANYYFKDPGSQTCEYREGYYGLTWYEQKVKRCDDGKDSATPNDSTISHNTSNGNLIENNVCLADNDCGIFNDIVCEEDIDCGAGVCANNECHYACVLDDWDNECETDFDIAPKTIGYGGAGNRIYQPTDNWAGLCPAYESSCTEIIDPASEPSVNLLFNSDFSQNVSGGKDGWTKNSQTIQLTKNTLYSLKVENVKIDSLTNCAQYYLSADENKLVDGMLTPNDRQNILFYSGDQENCVIKVGEFQQNPKITLRKAVVNYQKQDNLDFASCNGEYNYAEGCILFNERSMNGGQGYQKLVYDVDGVTTASDATQSLPNCNDGSVNCDTNKVIKVQPDRICNEWLACKTKVTIDEEQVCYDIGICDGLDANNQCSSWVSRYRQDNQELSAQGGQGNAADFRNTTGYSKVGVANIINSDMRGDYKLGVMEQVGELAIVPNGSFEFYGSNGYPTGWSKSAPTDAWSANMFSIINNAITAQEEGGIEYPIDGKVFLKYAPSTSEMESEWIDVEHGDYVLSFEINTLNFLASNSSLQVKVISNDGSTNNIETPALNNWHQKVHEFTVATNINRIKIKISGVYGSDDTCINQHEKCPGNVYLDNIQLRPALKTRDEWRTPQSCRLYPESDSLSCNYLDDNFINQRGWYGYCLEYDRSPGDENACLLWWPVDRVKGDGFDNSGGYNGRAPLYYCLEAKQDLPTAPPYPIEQRFSPVITNLNNNPVVELDAGLRIHKDLLTEFVLDVQIDGAHNNQCEGTQQITFTYSDAEPDKFKATDCTCGNNRKCWIANVWINVSGDIPISIEGDLADTSSNKHWQKWSNLAVSKVNLPYCTTVVQTIDSVGQGKYWFSRIQEGSDHTVTDLGYKYIYDYYPFGAAVPPAPIENPYEWDGGSAPGKQPLYIMPGGNIAVGGSPYSCSQDESETVACKIGRCSEHQEQICINNNDCDRGDVCIVSDINVTARGDKPTGSVASGMKSLASLFVQSYGTWNWGGDEEDDTCEGESEKGQCEYGGTPENGCTTSLHNDCQKELISCVEVSEKVCVGGLNNGGTCTGNPNCKFTQTDFGAHCDGDNKCDPITKNPGAFCIIDDVESILDNCWSYVSGASINGTCEENSSGPFCSMNGVITDINCIQETKNTICGGIVNNCIPDTLGACVNNPIKICSQDLDCGKIIGGTGYQVSSDSNYSWNAGDVDVCNGGVRSANTNCAILPKVKNIKVNNSEEDITINSNGFVNLTFNTDVDDEQLPLTTLAVDWGDGETTIVSGIEMRDRPSTDNPHSFYHLYDYWDLVSKGKGNCSGGSCTIKPKIWVKDNWGWYSGSDGINTPPINNIPTFAEDIIISEH